MVTRRQVPVESREVDAVGSADVEAIVRGYLAWLVRRYSPVAIGLALLAILALTVPSASPQRDLTIAESGSDFGVDDGTTSAASPGATGGPIEDGDVSGATGSDGSPGAAGPSSSGAAPVVADGTPAASGATCGPDVRQVSWTTYGPSCTPAWDGDNGGATAPGVSRDAITMSYRVANSGQGAALQAAAPSTAKTLDQRAYLEDLATYVEFFNTQFELYGRTVVLKEFSGRGDWIAEYQGQNVEGAQADGAQARSLGAFGDLSMGPTSSTPAYIRALASNQVISFGGATLGQATFEAMAPFAYSVESSFDDYGTFYGNVACQRMSQLPASFAGDPALASKPRAFGLIHPENPDYAPGGDIVVSKLKACGDPVASRIRYSINLATLQSQSSNAMAQMKAAGVSTIVCICDGISAIFFTSAADSQRYRPEWLMMGRSDHTARRWTKDQLAGSLTAGGIQRAEQSEAYRVYKLANRTGEPATPGWTLDLAYQSALMTFSALQAAGPALNPESLQRGFFGLPDSPAAGDYAAWEFGPKRFTPTAGLRLGYWDPAAPSPVAGGNGAWVPCAGEDGAFRPWEPAEGYGSKASPLRCFGK